MSHERAKGWQPAKVGKKENDAQRNKDIPADLGFRSHNVFSLEQIDGRKKTGLLLDLTKIERKHKRHAAATPGHTHTAN
jgi:hypothetical protein